MIYGKSLKEYLDANRYLLLFAFIITVAQVILLLLKIFPFMSVYTNLFSLLKVFLVAIAGWIVVKKYNFGLKNVFFTGCLFFIITVLLVLPFLSNIFTISGLVWLGILNFVVIILVTFFGGWLAKKISKK